MLERSRPLRDKADELGKTGDLTTARAARPARGKSVSKTAAFPEASDLRPRPLDLSKPYVVRSLNCTTNKPLHLGHLRNVVLGAATAGSLEALGARVVRHCVLEDTGRFMTEAMAAVRDFESSGAAAEVTAAKPDHFVGACYRRYREKLAAAGAQKDASGGRASKAHSGKGASGEGRSDGGDSGGGGFGKGGYGKGSAGKVAEAATGYEARGDEADDLMRALAHGEEDALRLRARVREMALGGQQATLQRIGVSFDRCDYESAEDPQLAGFLAACSERGLLRRNAKGELEYRTSGGRRLRLVNRIGLAEESARLLSFNHRLAGTRVADHATVIMAGSEWKGSMSAYAELLSRLGVGDIASLYAPTFYGMVMLDGKKMASSTGTGLLIDDLVDKLADDGRVKAFSRQCNGLHEPDEFAAMVTKCFLLSFARTETIDFTLERLNSGEVNPGWTIAAAWADLARRGAASPGGPASPGALRVIADALSRFSFEAAVRRAKEIAERVVGGAAGDADARDFVALVTALSVVPRRSDFVFSRAASLAAAGAGG